MSDKTGHMVSDPIAEKLVTHYRGEKLLQSMHYTHDDLVTTALNVLGHLKAADLLVIDANDPATVERFAKYLVRTDPYMDSTEWAECRQDYWIARARNTLAALAMPRDDEKIDLITGGEPTASDECGYYDVRSMKNCEQLPGHPGEHSARVEHGMGYWDAEPAPDTCEYPRFTVDDEGPYVFCKLSKGHRGEEHISNGWRWHLTDELNQPEHGPVWQDSNPRLPWQTPRCKCGDPDCEKVVSQGKSTNL